GSRSAAAGRGTGANATRLQKNRRQGASTCPTTIKTFSFMIYPENAIDKLGFSEIRELIKERCLSEAGRNMVDKIQPQTKIDQIDRFLRQTHEFKQLLLHDEPLPVDHIYAIKPLAEKVKLEGAFLLEEELYRMLLALRTVF